MKKVAVILSGSGVFDGAELHEAVLTLLAIEQCGGSYQCFAPDKPQLHVVNHLTSEVSEGETRNVLVESARIARGDIKPVTECHVEDFDALINEAINQKSFSLAVRYLYLKALKELNQKELIVVKEAKTNYDYLQELRGHPVEQTFDRLTYFHEYVDYGEFEIDEPRFHKIKEVFDTFLRRLHE